MGYVTALTQLAAKLRQDATIKGPALTKALEHIQDLLHRCAGCGGWLFSDGSCITCEMKAKQEPVKKAVKKK